jgi:hypothetical protein
MKRTILKIAVFGLLVTAIAATPTQTQAQEKKEKKEKTTEKRDHAKTDRALPFHGKIAALDKQAKTVKVGERVFQITSETKITKDGKPATLDDAAVGEIVGGSYTKSDGGKLTAKSLRIGPKPEGEAKTGDKKKQKKGE